MQSKPNWQDLATLWMTTHYQEKPAVVIFKPLFDPDNMAKKVGVLRRLSAFDPETVSAEFVVSPQDTLQQAGEACQSIPNTLMFAMVWDGSAFTDDN